MNYRTLACWSALLCTPVAAQSAKSPPPAVTWPQIQSQFKCPAWYSDAKFGIWVHWGAQSQPSEGGGWYARHMYMQDVGRETWGKGAYNYQIKHYGHPSEKGFKDVIHAWKADKLDTDSLVTYFKSIGAKYFVALANHHDHFDNFASTYQPWNSVNVGPKKDIIGAFAASSRKVGMPFGVSSHDDRMKMFYQYAFASDKTGPKAGVPYDGNLTKADGKGQWWDGLDPADLYGPPPAKQTKEWAEGMKRNWELRHKELIDKYHPDMLWFDGYGFPYAEHGKEVCRYFYQDALRRKGKLDSVVVAKIPGDPAIIKDVERGVAQQILPTPWQGTTTFTDWFLKTDVPIKHSSRTVIETLCDILSKNGNLLLNVELRGDGSLPADHKVILDGVGAWVNLNADAIYGTHPWKVYGDNIGSKLKSLEGSEIGAVDIDAAKKNAKEDFNERTLKSPPYGEREVRFAIKGTRLFIYVLNPTEGPIKLPALGLDSPQKPGSITGIRLIGSSARIQFKQDKDGLLLDVPKVRPSAYAAVFEVAGAL